jgi:membrane-anchored protein YejM (alkaline phosphatase superfamily)
VGKPVTITRHSFTIYELSWLGGAKVNKPPWWQYIDSLSEEEQDALFHKTLMEDEEMKAALEEQYQMAMQSIDDMVQLHIDNWRK